MSSKRVKLLAHCSLCTHSFKTFFSFPPYFPRTIYLGKRQFFNHDNDMHSVTWWTLDHFSNGHLTIVNHISSSHFASQIDLTDQPQRIRCNHLAIVTIISRALGQMGKSDSGWRRKKFIYKERHRKFIISAGSKINQFGVSIASNYLRPFDIKFSKWKITELYFGIFHSVA